MPVKAGQIVVNLTLGQAQFLERIMGAKAGITDLSAAAKKAMEETRQKANEAALQVKLIGDSAASSGAKLQQMGHAGSAATSNFIASSAAIRALEGNVNNNIRAVERFLGVTLGLGPVFDKIFPIVGATAFGGLIVELGEKVYKFFKDIEEAPAKMQAAFRGLQQPLDTSNDELDLANARLQASIDKLEGRPENGLALSLNEAKFAADKLGDALEHDLDALNKLLKDQHLSPLQAIFTTGGPATGTATEALSQVLGGKSGMAGIEAKIQAIRDDEARQLEALKTGGKLVGGAAGLLFDKPSSIPGYTLGQIQVLGQPRPGQYSSGQINIGDLGKQLPLKSADSIRHTADAAIEKIYQNIADGISGILTSPDITQADKEALTKAQSYILGQVRKVAASEKETDLTQRNNALKAQPAPAPGINTDALRRRSAEETNRLLEQLAAATEKNLTVWDAINAKTQEMMREAVRANTPENVIGPAVVPQGQVDLIQRIADAERTRESTKALKEFNEAMLAVEGEWLKFSGKQSEATNKLLFPKIDTKSYDEQERFDNTRWNADREATTRQAGFADRMAEVGGASQEEKINAAYERRIELANQLQGIEQKRIDAELDLETKIHLMQEQEITNEKAMQEAEQERELKLAELRQQRVKEYTDPAISGVSGELANAMTGKKTHFGQTFENVGHQMLEGSLKKLLTFGVGKVDGSSADKALWVRMAGGGGGSLSRDPGSGEAPEYEGLGGILGISHSEGPGEGSGEGSDESASTASKIAKIAGGSGIGGILGKLIASLFGKGGSNPMTNAPMEGGDIAYGGAMAGGGGVEAGTAYKVNENESEYFIPGRAGQIVPSSKMGGGGDIHIHNHVDARNAELGAANRIHRALEATHASAVKTAMHAMSEHQKRTVHH